jgi:Cof subfamily protein (haloacid dehalogenase superfamily)
MQTKMIVTDLDSTLLRTDKTISDYSLAIFKACREKGVKTVFATARPLYLTTEYTSSIIIDGLIATNGAFIYAGDKIISEHMLPLDTSQALLAELSASPKVIRIGARKRDAYYTTGPVHESDIHYDFKKPLDEQIAHISFRTDNPALARAIARKHPELEIVQTSGENHYDIGAAGCTKAKGVKELSSWFGINTENIVAFGDDYNDIKMLSECGMGVAVANAIDEVKAVADCICESNDDDGVAKWLEENVR